MLINTLKLYTSLAPKVLKPGSLLDGITMMTTSILPKYLVSFRPGFTQPVLNGAREEAFYLKQGDDEAIEQLDIHLINILLSMGYPKTS